MCVILSNAKDLITPTSCTQILRFAQNDNKSTLTNHRHD